MRFGLGVVMGKFYPPHHGHRLLIDTALARCDTVVVFLCVRPVDTIPGARREAWLRELHPRADVRVIDDRDDENDTRVWAANTLRWLGRAPDAVFTSESYGEPYARLMGATHVPVDPSRRHQPVSGTAVRGDPFAHWDFIAPPVRAWFARRVCVLGAESTGTTTLARALAARWRTNWVAEYGREYSAEKQRRPDATWRTAEFVHIAEEQTRREDAAAAASNRVVICDTNALATTLWHRRYVGGNSPAVDAVAARGRCDLYLLTGDEIPFVQDGLRDGEHRRHEMHRWFEEMLRAQSVPWTLLRGPPAERLVAASKAVDALFAASRWRPTPAEA